MQEHLSPSLELAVLQSRTLPQLVQQDIEQLILSGELRAGERLNEVAIARRLGVSRGPIREALRTLEEAGLLRFEKMRGMAVATSHLRRHPTYTSCGPAWKRSFASAPRPA
jgi:DNA-binding GntR family transcriptional regulator